MTLPDALDTVDDVAVAIPPAVKVRSGVAGSLMAMFHCCGRTGWRWSVIAGEHDRFVRPSVLVAAFGGGAVMTFVLWFADRGDPVTALLMAVVAGSAMVAGILVADRVMAGRSRRKRREIQDFTGSPHEDQ